MNSINRNIFWKLWKLPSPEAIQKVKHIYNHYVDATFGWSWHFNKGCQVNSLNVVSSSLFIQLSMEIFNRSYL